MAADSEVEDVDWEDDEGYSREVNNWQRQDRERQDMGEKTPTALQIAALALAEANAKRDAAVKAQVEANAAVAAAGTALNAAQRQLAAILPNSQSVIVGDTVFSQLSGNIYTTKLSK